MTVVRMFAKKNKKTSHIILTVATSPIMAYAAWMFWTDDSVTGLHVFIHELGHWVLFLGFAEIDGNITYGYWPGIGTQFGGYLSTNAVCAALGILGARYFKPLMVFGLAGAGTLFIEVLGSGQFNGDKSIGPFVLWPLVSLVTTTTVVVLVIREARREHNRLADKPHAEQGRTFLERIGLRR